MPPLSPASTQALTHLRTFLPPTPGPYNTLPHRRRAAVLVLLYAAPSGALHVVLTLRSRTLRTFAGQVALPGGRSDSDSETAVETARREAWEEIGLPLGERIGPPPPLSSSSSTSTSTNGVTGINAGTEGREGGGGGGEWTVQHLCELPCHLARTQLVVRPVIAYLSSTSSFPSAADAGSQLVPRLQEREVAAVFTAPLEGFLRRRWGGGDGGGWYEGRWLRIQNNTTDWRAHEFLVRDGDRSFRVWGMTARVLVDAARVAYGRRPEFEAEVEPAGDEAMIMEMMRRGEFEKEREKEKEGKEGKPKIAVRAEVGDAEGKAGTQQAQAQTQDGKSAEGTKEKL